MDRLGLAAVEGCPNPQVDTYGVTTLLLYSNIIFLKLLEPIPLIQILNGLGCSSV